MQNVKIVPFSLIDYRDGTVDSYELKLCQNASQGMQRIPYTKANAKAKVMPNKATE